MTIGLYLNNSEQTEITRFYNITSNPFNVGDVIRLDVKDTEHLIKRMFKSADNLLDKNKKLFEKFHLKNIIIVSEFKFISVDIVNESDITIEYFCKICD